ncbi:MAG TPA: hypothetical protein VJB96_01150 [Patescibacteria group bacterium]|nr:hypothetical protein [Patescibacteria group bacterium]
MKKVEVRPLTNEQCEKMGRDHPYFRILDKILQKEWTFEACERYREKHGHAGLILELVRKARIQAGLEEEI